MAQNVTTGHKKTFRRRVSHCHSKYVKISEMNLLTTCRYHWREHQAAAGSSPHSGRSCRAGGHCDWLGRKLFTNWGVTAARTGWESRKLSSQESRLPMIVTRTSGHSSVILISTVSFADLSTGSRDLKILWRCLASRVRCLRITSSQSTNDKKHSGEGWCSRGIYETIFIKFSIGGKAAVADLYTERFIFWKLYRNENYFRRTRHDD